jgi:acetyl-CoA carboxylase carboxyltransferase component
MTWEPELEEIHRRRDAAYGMGGVERIADQRARGKLPVRERIDALVDPGSFLERGVLGGSADYDPDGELTEFRPKATVFGMARIDGRPVALTAQDYTARPGSGSQGESGRGGGATPRSYSAEHIAHELKLPFIRLIDGFGGDIRAVAGMNRTYVPQGDWSVPNTLLSEVPVVSAPLGSVAGLPAAWVPASHFSVMVQGISQVFAAGPPVVQRAIGLDIDKEDLGGYRQHARGSGVVDNEAEDEPDAFHQIRRFLSYLPTSVWELPPVEPASDPRDRRDEGLLSMIPRERNRPYDPRTLVRMVLDEGSLFEHARYYGGSQITMFARLNGRPVGVLANDPLVHGGAMDADAARKLERFVDLCDSFHLPIINFADQPGFMIGPSAERAGTLRAGMRAIVAIGQATVPWATVIVRRVYGVAGAAHQAHSHFNFRVAWPSGEWGSLPIEGGVAAAYRREIDAADDPDAYRASLEARLVAMRSPFRTAEVLDIEDIIDPRDTRPLLSDWLDFAYSKLRLNIGVKLRPMRP